MKLFEAVNAAATGALNAASVVAYLYFTVFVVYPIKASYTLVTAPYQITVKSFSLATSTIRQTKRVIRYVIPGGRSSSRRNPPLSKDYMTSIAKEENDLHKTYSIMSGYVLLVKEAEYDADVVIALKPRDIQKFLAKKSSKGPKSPLQQSTAEMEVAVVDKHGKNYRKQFIDKHLRYADIVASDGILKIYKSGVDKSNGTLINLRDFSVELIQPQSSAPGRQFSRIHPIKVSPRSSTEEGQVYYIYAPTGIEKEQWFISLNKASNRVQTDAYVQSHKNYMDEVISHVDQLNGPSSSTPSVDLMCLNLILGRMWATLCNQQHVNTFIKDKLEKKLARMNKPKFVGDLVIKDLYTGSSLPVFSNIHDVKYDNYGQVSFLANVHYNGRFRIEMETEAKFDVSSIKSYKVKLLLEWIIEEVRGEVMIKIPPLPSTRIWWAFTQLPFMKNQIRPVVNEQSIKMGLNMIKDAFESKIVEAMEDVIVLPNMDEIQIWKCDGSDIEWGVVRRGELVEHPNAQSQLIEKQQSQVGNKRGKKHKKDQSSTSSNGSDVIAEQLQSSLQQLQDQMPAIEEDFGSNNSDRRKSTSSLAQILSENNGMTTQEKLELAAESIPALNLSPNMSRKNRFSPPQSQRVMGGDLVNVLAPGSANVGNGQNGSKGQESSKIMQWASFYSQQIKKGSGHQREKSGGGIAKWGMRKPSTTTSDNGNAMEQSPSTMVSTSSLSVIQDANSEISQ
ncbi:hypothetical protein MP228_000476 [Amoeboaphelidium protococcarum]|nr:hypothetical protein MP228_000476 [Amoeboaphelidium protococcarum]